MPDQRVERILEQLRQDGSRMTVPRRLLVEALVAIDGHVTADELATRLQETDPRINASTVYRNLDALERLGIVEHVHLSHGRAVYHLVEDLHHHLVCDRCGAVVEVPGRILAGVTRTVRRDYGFTVHPYHFALAGTCRDCKAQGATNYNLSH